MARTSKHAACVVLVAVCVLFVATAAGQYTYACDHGKKGLPSGVIVAPLGNALLQLYAALIGKPDSPPWHNVPATAMCGQCTASGNELPSYCCWPGVFCCAEEGDDAAGCAAASAVMVVNHLAMRGFGLQGRLDDKRAFTSLEKLGDAGLQSIDLSSNALRGSIPASIGRLTHLQTINLNLNHLTGTIPQEIANLGNLQNFYASFNNLTGPLDDRFCIANSSNLYSLILRANHFSGQINMTRCTGLGLLDVQDNKFRGELPVGFSNQKLISLRISNNLFDSSIPEALWRLPQLATLEAANNMLTGTLSPFFGSANNLVNVRLGNNSLKGTIPGNVSSNSQMLLLELYDNIGLVGTFPDSKSMVGIRQLDLHNTSISGTIPSSWGKLPYLQLVDITFTRMTCCNNQSQVDELASRGANALLPSFLEFNSKLQQFDTTRHVQKNLLDPDQPGDVLCGSVQRRRQNISDWNEYNLPVTNDAVNTQRWMLGPLYSWYMNCTCPDGYEKDNTSLVPVKTTQMWCNDPRAPWVGPCINATIFRCVPRQPPSLSLTQRVAIGIVVAVCGVMLLVAANMCMAHASKMRRYYVRAKTRLQGTPKHGKLSLVVTDIEGYSDIFKRAPEVMFRALVMHNGVIRAAKYANCGFVLEQEGDSFTLAFYDAFDAVAFCLQAQQALLAVAWPEGLDPDDSSVHAADSITSRKPSRLQQRLSQLLTSGTRKRGQMRSAASSTLSEFDTGAGAPSISLHVSPSQHLTRLAGFSGLRSPPPGEAPLFSGLRVRMGVCTGEVPSGTPIKSSALFQLAKVVSDFGNGGQVILDHTTFAAVKEQLTVLGAVEGSGINYRRLATHRSLWTSLKVLLGCASPQAAGEEAVVLDMGAYCQGQAGGDDTEFGGSLTSPGAADLRCDASSKEHLDGCCRNWSAWWQQLRSGGSSSSGGAGSDGGLCLSPGLRANKSDGPPAAAGEQQGLRLQLASMFRTNSSSSSTTTDPYSQPSRHLALQQMPTARFSGEVVDPPVGRLASFPRQLKKTGSMRGVALNRDWNSVRLFQILPPALAARAHVWHNQLNVKDGWRCWDMPYFDAPGSTAVPLSGGGSDPLGFSLQHGSATPSHVRRASSGNSSNGDPSGPSAEPSNPGMLQQLGLQPLLQPLPPVTMVFMAVENPEQLVRRRRSFTPKVQSLLNRVVRDGLRRCGGYLCRVQEGDLKFMVAFGSPVVALEWCVTVQEAAMYLPWPAEPVLLYEGCTAERDERGNVVLRGPRIKMGVCEGVPKSVLPDHEGRADFHGPSVNMAARFMDKAAKGGQIACTLGLAQKVMAYWAWDSRDGSWDGGTATATSPVDQQQGMVQQQAGPAAAGDGAEHPQQGVDAGLGPGSSAAGADGHRSSSNPGSPRKSNKSRFAGNKQLAWRQHSWRRQAPPAQGADAAAAPGTAAAAAAGSTVDVMPLTCSAQQDCSPFAVRGSTAGPDCSRDDLPAGGAVSEGGSSMGGSSSRQSSFVGSRPPVAAGGRYRGGSCHHVDTGLDSIDSGHALGSDLLQHNRASSSAPGSLGLSDALLRQQQQQRHALLLQQSSSQQQQLKLPPLRVSQPQVTPAPAAGAASGFVLKHVPKAAVQLEVHRLGLFAFKGGPHEQEMVQIVPTHLLGRLKYTGGSVAASRKGQLLQKLEGRVGEPVTAQLPTLAQEYKALLPERLLSPSNRMPGRSSTFSPERSGSSFTLPPTNSAPVPAGAESPEGVSWGASAQPPLGIDAAAGSGWGSGKGGSRVGARGHLAGLRVMSDVSAGTHGSWARRPLGICVPEEDDLSAGGDSGVGGDDGVSLSPAAVRQQSSTSEGTGVDRLASLGKASGRDHVSITLPSSGQQKAAAGGGDLGLDDSGSGEGCCEEGVPAAAAAGASVSSAQGSGLLRHDSFRSVGSDGDEEMGGGGGGTALRQASKSSSSGMGGELSALRQMMQQGAATDL